MLQCTSVSKVLRLFMVGILWDFEDAGTKIVDINIREVLRIFFQIPMTIAGFDFQKISPN